MNLEELKTRTAYSVIPFNGLFLFLHLTPEGNAAMIRICDEDYRITTSPAAIQPASAYKYSGSASLFDICAEAIQRYKLDPARVLRAACIANKHGMSGNAARDENGETITPNPRVKWIRGSKGGFYTVYKKFCTCEDHKNGQTCKHRIASWMIDEQYLRRTAYATSQPREKISAMYYATSEPAEVF